MAFNQPRVVVTERLKATGLPLVEHFCIVVCSSSYSPGDVRGTEAKCDFSDQTTERNCCVLNVNSVQHKSKKNRKHCSGLFSNAVLLQLTLEGLDSPSYSYSKFLSVH